MSWAEDSDVIALDEKRNVVLIESVSDCLGFESGIEPGYTHERIFH